MTVEPGFGGQSFMNDQINKIEKLQIDVEGAEFEILNSIDLQK